MTRERYWWQTFLPKEDVMDDKAVIPEGCVVAAGQIVEACIIDDERQTVHVDAVAVGDPKDVVYWLSWRGMLAAHRMQLNASAVQFYGKPRLLRISEEKTEPQS